MGSLQFRKSKNIGPVRVTASKRGLSASVGAGPFRLTRKVNGGVQGTARIPGSGIRYVQQLSPAKKRSPVGDYLYSCVPWIIGGGLIGAALGIYEWVVNL